MGLIAADVDDDDEITTGRLVFRGYGAGWRNGATVPGGGTVPTRGDPSGVVLEDGLEHKVGTLPVALAKVALDSFFHCGHISPAIGQGHVIRVTSPDRIFHRPKGHRFERRNGQFRGRTPSQYKGQQPGDNDLSDVYGFQT